MRGILFCLTLVLAGNLHAATGAGDFRDLLKKGGDYRRQGQLLLAIETLESAQKLAADDKDGMLAAGELGAAYLQAHRLFDAGLNLRKAHAAAEGALKARYAVDLGSWAAARQEPEQAQEFWQEARSNPAASPAIKISAALNMARLAPLDERLQRLRQADKEIPAISEPREQARFRLNLGIQARGAGTEALKLAYDNLRAARDSAQQLQDKALLVEAIDALAQLYEDQKRSQDALRLTDEAIAIAAVPDHQWLLVQLQWRKGRLHRELGQAPDALAAYQRAVEYIEGLRQDIPVEYDGGRSSFRETLEPIYLGLADLLLLQSPAHPEKEAEYLKRARDTVELIKQSELQDYLGDRCTVETVQQNHPLSSLPAGTAVLYPIILPDRLDLLLETGGGIRRHSIAVSSQEVQRTALALGLALRNGDDKFEKLSRRLYEWFLRPYESIFAEQKLDTLVVVPDGPLRLVPFGALHDGKEYAIQKFAVATAPGLTMTQSTGLAKRNAIVPLLAGLSDPGPVVEKVMDAGTDQAIGSSADEAALSSANRNWSTGQKGRSSTNPLQVSRGLSQEERLRAADQLRQRLALPGVKEEIESLFKETGGQVILNQNFTAEDFRRNVQTGNYNVVHIASHGLFGGSAETSFIMAYDEVITIDGFQSLLQSEQLKKNPIELVTLSACQTAEGDDRAPLGIAGAALKARARSALGTLWPVADDAAKEIMAKFYASLTAGKSKVESLREAQKSLIGDDKMSHPFFWAPFILVGNWM